MFKQLILLFVILNSLVLGFSDEYYGDLKIVIDELGKTSISGTTNYNDLIVTNSDKFTSKKGSIWTFELLVPVEFSEFIFELELPAKTQVNYLKTTPTFRITSGDNDNIKVIGTGENRKLSILVQYVFDEDLKLFTFFGYYFSYLILGLIVLLIFGFMIFRKIKKNKIMDKAEDKIEQVVSEVLNFDYSKLNLNQRQIRIVEILKRYEKISQKDLEIELGIPKASVSRNLQSLCAKKVVLIEKNGISNIVSLLK